MSEMPPRDVLLLAAQAVIDMPAFRTEKDTSKAIDCVVRAILAERERVLVAANSYLKGQYGIHPLENPIDRARVDRLLAE